MFAYIGFVARTFGSNITPANISSVLYSAETIFAYLLQFLILGEATNYVSFIGAVVLTIAVIFLGFSKKFTNEDEEIR